MPPSPPQLPPLPPLPPLSLYVHFPWCVRKCPYCDFNSHTLQGVLPADDYVEALLCDLSWQAGAVQGRALQSIFLGGGTPSLFAPQALARLLAGVRERCDVAADLEVTLEANPGTIERGRFADYRTAGINRVSLGAQSFDTEQLQRLGRIHSTADTRRAVAELHAAGLTNFNLDLMYGLPQQTIAQALADIEQAVALEPQHLSVYQLTLEPGTVFAGRPPPGLPDTDLCADMQLACQQRLAAAQYEQYEVSAYARPGRRCRHNLNYWLFGDYLGIGAGAHGKCSRIEGGRLVIERSTQPREPRRYLAAVGAVATGVIATGVDASGAATTGDAATGVGATGVRVPTAELPFEYMLNALRLTDGFEQLDFEQRTGLPFSSIAEPLAMALGRGLLQRRGSSWRASELGFDFLNDLVTLFLPTTNAVGLPPTAQPRKTA
jgi:oxygen-independent coproporphyrinogen-3 oxidase